MLEKILSLIGGGTLGSFITYLLTLKSKTKQANAEAKSKEIQTQHEQLDLNQDMCDYLQKVTDKYIRDYHELESDFRKQITEVRDTTERLMEEKSKIIASKCSEIAQLQARVAYLEGVSCYDFTCEKRQESKKNEC